VAAVTFVMPAHSRSKNGVAYVASIHVLVRDVLEDVDGRNNSGHDADSDVQTPYLSAYGDKPGHDGTGGFPRPNLARSPPAPVPKYFAGAPSNTTTT
jgi:hypothetical protein